jgi:4'-phosphopantetheinyl transferase
MDVPPLRPNDVHLWWIDLARSGDDAPILSWEERERAARLRRPDDRRRWSTAHVALRHILARYSGVAPHEVSLTTGAAGKPALGAGSPQFSLSHAGERALLAVARCEVGVDLEVVDRHILAESGLPRLMAKVCAPQEVARLMALPVEERRMAFLRYWVLKEAFLKGIGAGLMREPGTVIPHPQPFSQRNGRGALHPATHPDGSTPWRGVEGQYTVMRAPDWTLHLLNVGSGWVAALAVRSGEPAVFSFRWPGEETGTC